MTAFERRPGADLIERVVHHANTAAWIDEVDTSVIFHDLDLLDERLAELATTFPAQTLHAVAIKANPVVEVLRTVVAAGHGLEAASIEEVMLAVAAGCPSDRIVFDSPAKTTAEIVGALDLGVRINADNFDELDRIERLVTDAHTSVLGLRINPLVGSGSIPTTGVAGATSKFGVPVDTVLEPLVQRARRLPLLRCLHVHIGSQGVGADAHERAAAVISGLRSDVHRELGVAQFDVVDLGGGMSTNYVGDTAMSPAQIADGIRRSAPELLADDVQLVTEYGRSVQANCGWAVSRIEYIKSVAEQPMAVIHLGADLLLRPVYQPEYWRHRISRLGGPRDDGATDVRWTVSGPLCFAGDVIARGVELGALSNEDSLVIHDVGAYTVSMWNRHCSRGIPKILGYRQHGNRIGVHLLRHRETPEDIVRFWSANP